MSSVNSLCEFLCHCNDKKILAQRLCIIMFIGIRIPLFYLKLTYILE